MNSPASLAEGMKRCPVDIEGKGAGGGLGIKPQYNLAYDESNKSLIFYLLTPLRLEAECTIPPPYPPPLLTGEAGEFVTKKQMNTKC